MLRSTATPFLPEVTWTVAGIRGNDHDMQLLSSIAQDVEHNLLNSVRRSIDQDDRGRAVLGALLDNTSESYVLSSPLEWLGGSRTDRSNLVAVLLTALAMAPLMFGFFKLMPRGRTRRAAALATTGHRPAGANAKRMRGPGIMFRTRVEAFGIVRRDAGRRDRQSRRAAHNSARATPRLDCASPTVAQRARSLRVMNGALSLP